MKIGIMQPYFFPYIGYFQLMIAVDFLVVYDNIQYTKKGWISRNRILSNGAGEYISIPLKKDSDFLNVNKRCLAESWNTDKKRIINKIRESYRKAPFINNTMSLIEECINYDDGNLFNFLFNSLEKISEHLNIKTPLVISSSLDYNNDLKSEQKVIAICKALNATRYLNPVGGVELYNKETFLNENIELKFLKTTEISYSQFNNEFIPFLSIIDVMMFNEKQKIQDYLYTKYMIR